MNPMTQEKPTVLIVGAGLGGVTLGLILEAAGVPYAIFEKATSVKPLGSALSLGPTVLPLFKQLGIYDEVLSKCKAHTITQDYSEDRRPVGVIDWRLVQELGGYGAQIIARPVLYDILRRGIPADKIHMKKKLVSYFDEDDSVTLDFADGTQYKGHVLIGADGAYSTVRRLMYAKIKEAGQLPEEDEGALPYRTTCLVGQTAPQSPEEFPEMRTEECTFYAVRGIIEPYTRAVFASKENTHLWMVVHHLNEELSSSQDKQESNHNSEWGPEAAEAMCKEVRHLTIPGGNGNMTIGDLIDRTPKDLISKVMLEEKVFETWYGDRVALLGDSCHKFDPAGGAGAVNAIQDAICLGNWINTLPKTISTKELRIVFQDYLAERLPIAKENFAKSQFFASLKENTWTAMGLRFMVYNIPEFLHRKVLVKMMENRPQLSFLPYVKDEGSVPAMSQHSLIHTGWIIESVEQEAARNARKSNAASPVVAV
ncbi:hypothetical protein BG003_003941 [Podila horticola]|nr:hypothetical protein BG003_003941 [Podila horticola]